MKEVGKENYIDFYLRHAWHRISRMYNQKAKEYGASMSVGFILLIIEKEGTPSTQLGPRMGMEPTSLSRTLKSMEEKDYIFRKIDEKDKRRVLIFLTEKGLQMRKEAKKVVVDFNEKLLAAISKDQLEAFLGLMKIVDKHVEDELDLLNNI